MNDTIEQLAQKNLIQTLDLVRSDRPDSEKPDGFKPDQWHAVCNGQIEILITNTIDLVGILLREKEDMMQGIHADLVSEEYDPYNPPKRGNYKGKVDGYVQNGDYV